MAATLGHWNPIRYRGYYYDVETGLYYLRSRYYNPVMERFLNADSLYENNRFSYCSNGPVLLKDTDGLKGKKLSTDNICVFGADDWGTHETPLPVSVLIDVALTIYGEGGWNYVYQSLKYQKIDCIGLILIAAKFYFTKNAFRKKYDIGTGTKSALGHHNNTFELKKTMETDIATLRIGTILYCPSLSGKKRGHVGIYIGYYDDGTGHPIDHAVIHCHGGEEAGISIQSIYDSRFYCEDGEFTEYNYLDYDLTYMDTLNRGV